MMISSTPKYTQDAISRRFRVYKDYVRSRPSLLKSTSSTHNPHTSLKHINIQAFTHLILAIPLHIIYLTNTMKFTTSAAHALLVLLPIAIDAAAIDMTGGKAVTARSEDAGQLFSRGDDCPTVDQIEKWLYENTSTGPNIVFSTARPMEDQVVKFAASKGASDFGKAFGNQGTEWQKLCSTEQDLDARMSEAFARTATGDTAYLVLGDEPIEETSYWRRSEYATLAAKKMKIIAVCDDAFDQTEEYVPHNNPFQAGQESPSPSKLRREIAF